MFGWVIVGPGNEAPIPPDAYREYGFQAGEPVVFILGSQRSGGFGLGRREGPVLFPIRSRILEEGVLGEEMKVRLPRAFQLQPGEKLLAVRGSGLALGFLQRGPIYEEALRHPEIEVFAP